MNIIDNKYVFLRTRRPHLITEQVSDYRIIREDSDGFFELSVKWEMEEAQALAKLGVKLPSPIQRDYKWTGKYTPFDHQRETASFLSIRKKAFCFNEQGTGKTASVIWAADYLMKLGLIRRVLVICPLSIMKSAWQQDLFTFAMHRGCSIAHGTAGQRKKIIEANADFVIINFDGVAVVEEDIAKAGFDLIVVDEANAYKNVQTNRWKTLNRLMKNTE
jgi:SNF2 family DNA or RNA helicase